MLRIDQEEVHGLVESLHSSGRRGIRSTSPEIIGCPFPYYPISNIMLLRCIQRLKPRLHRQRHCTIIIQRSKHQMHIGPLYTREVAVEHQRMQRYRLSVGRPPARYCKFYGEMLSDAKDKTSVSFSGKTRWQNPLRTPVQDVYSLPQRSSSPLSEAPLPLSF